MNGKNIVIWILQGLLAAVFLYGGSMKLAGSEAMVQVFRHLGYGDGFRIFVGAVEVAGGIALLIPRITTLASIGLMVIMIGAVYSHLASQDGWGAAMPAMVLSILLGIVTYARRNSLASLVNAISGHTPDISGAGKSGQAAFPLSKP